MRGVKKADIFVALFLVALFSVIVIGISAPKASGGDRYADITVRIDGVSYAVARNLHFEEIFLVDDKYPLELIGISEEPAYILRADRDGVIRKIPSETKYTVTLSLAAVGTGSDSGFLLGGVRYLAPNMDLTVSAEISRAVGKITHISELFSIYDKY